MANTIWEFGETGVSEITYSTDGDNYFNQPGKGQRIMFVETGFGQGYLRIGDIAIEQQAGSIYFATANGVDEAMLLVPSVAAP